MSRVASFSRIALLVLRSRVTRAFLIAAALVWAFDKLIFLATQRSFFASLGFERWFWRDLGAQIGLFSAFFVLCMLLTRVFLGALTRAPLETSPPLRGILAQLETLRPHVGRVSYVIAVVFALLLAREWARHSLDWIFLRHSAPSDFAFFGIAAALWTHFLPVFAPFLGLLWRFSLVLGVLVAATGTLRALPLLAARNAAPPLLTRVLWRFGAYLWALRATLYLVQILDLSRGRALESGDVWILAPLFALGAAACLFFCFTFWRRGSQTVFVMSPASSRAKGSKIVLGALAALFLPAILRVSSAPLRAFLPETPFLKSQRERATRAAWRLQDVTQVDGQVSGSQAGENLVPAEQIWPVWDEKSVLASRSGAARRASRIVTWKNATLGLENGKWSAILAGDGVNSSPLGSAPDADSSNALALERLELSGEQWVESALPKAAPAFFGLEGRSLFGQGDFGISVASIGSKWAWAWRLHDPILPLDSAASPRLLTFRGAKQRAEMLAPFLRASGEPQLRFVGGKWQWSLDLCATTHHFPGAPPLPSGELAGENAASPLKMRMDVATGAVRFVVPSPVSKIPNSRGALLESWHAAFPEMEIENATERRENWGANPAFLGAQAAMMAQIRGVATQIYAPQQSLLPRGTDAEKQVTWHVLSVQKNRFEVWQGSSGPIVQSGVGDLRARLDDLDAAAAQNAGSETPPLIYRVGEPFVWRDARAPGGFWVARGYFSKLRVGLEGAMPNPNLVPPDLSQIAGHGPVLWRVAVTGNQENARVGVANSLSAAILVATGQTDANAASGASTGAKTGAASDDASGAKTGAASNAKSNAPLNSKAPQKTLPLSEAGAPLEVLALRAHEASQAAVKSGDWKRYGTLAARETELLQRLAAQRLGPQRRKVTPQNSVKNPAVRTQATKNQATKTQAKPAQ